MSRLGIDVPEAFAIDVEPDRDLAIVRVHGELDLATADELELALLGMATQPVVVDLAGVTFLDSTALGVLLRVSGSRPAEAPFFLLDPRPELQRVFQITGVDRRLRFVSSVEEARSP